MKPKQLKTERQSDWLPATLAAAEACGYTGQEAEAFAWAFRDGFEQAYVAARTKERARLASILLSVHAEGREAYARHLALETDTAAAEAEQILALVPLARRLQFSAAMGQVENPNLGVSDGSQAPDGAGSFAAIASAVYRRKREGEGS